MLREPPNNSSPRDVELLESVAAGREQALAELHRRHGSMLVALALQMMRNREDAEDLVQDVFVQVWRQAGRYDPGRASVSTWIGMITRSRALDRFRNHQVRERTREKVTHLRLFPTSESASGDREVLRRERRERLQEVLGRLPKEQEEVLDLAYFSGLTQQEIAENKGIPLGTVKTRTMLALRKLRLALRGKAHELQ